MKKTDYTLLNSLSKMVLEQTTKAMEKQTELEKLEIAVENDNNFKNSTALSMAKTEYIEIIIKIPNLLELLDDEIKKLNP